MRKSLVLAAAAAACMCSAASAAVTYYDGFAGTAGNNLAGWTVSGPGNWQYSSTGLSYTKGGTLAVTGGSAVPANYTVGDIRLEATHTFGSAYSGGTIWVSFLVTDVGIPDWGWRSTALEAWRTTGDNSVWNERITSAGVENQANDVLDYSRLTASWSITDDSTGIVVSKTASQASLIVLKLDGVANTLDVYVNPTIGGATPTSSDFSLTNLGIVATDITNVRLVRLNGVGTSDAYMDEVRIGESFADVTPVPEPTSIGLIGLSLVGLAARRRRA